MSTPRMPTPAAVTSAPPVEPLRISDSERAHATALLGEHYAQGRLDLEEFDDRSTLAMAARYQDQLDTLLADLPSLDPVPASPPRVPDGSSRRCWTKSPVLLAPLAIAILVLTYGGALLALPLLWWAVTTRQRSGTLPRWNRRRKWMRPNRLLAP